jgi:hypothetical protein
MGQHTRKLASALLRIASLSLTLLGDAVRLALLVTRSNAALKAKNLFFRKQLALYLERKVKPWRADNAIRMSLVLLSKMFSWREIFTVVKPGDVITTPASRRPE